MLWHRPCGSSGYGDLLLMSLGQWVHMAIKPAWPLRVTELQVCYCLVEPLLLRSWPFSLALSGTNLGYPFCLAFENKSLSSSDTLYYYSAEAFLKVQQRSLHGLLHRID